MAIQFARIEIVSRKLGGNSCCKAAYNARMIIKDQQTNVTYNFVRQKDNVYHTVLLPSHVEQRFKDPEILMNEVERSETRKNSQLLKDIVIALPDDKELELRDRIAIIHEIIDEMAWVKNGVGVQVDIHKPHNGERNWHAHLLVTTRRFTKDGKSLGEKAVDLNPEFKKVGSKAFIIPELQMIHHRAKEVMNRYFAKLGLKNRVDPISMMPQQHLGPVRLRNIINEIAEQNELRKLAHLKIIQDSDGVLNRIIKHQAIFTKKDVVRAVKEIQGKEEKQKLIQGVLNSDRLVKLYNEDGKDTKYYTTCDIREEELRLLRIASKIHDNINYNIVGNIASLKEDIAKLSNISKSQREALQHILLQYNGIRTLRGRAGTGKSQLLATAYKLVTHHGQNIIGLSPTHKAVSELKSKGYQECYTVKGFLFKLYNGKVTLPNNSLLVVDEAGMVSNSDYLELFKFARSSNCNVILAGDEKQLTSIERGGMFEIFASTFGSYVLSDIRRQSQQWAREMALCFAKSDIAAGLMLLERHNGLKIDHTLEESMARLINDWNSSRFNLQERLIITVDNQEVDSINQGIRELLKVSGILTGKECRRFILGSKSDKQHEDYMVGDRILFKATHKEIQIENGEFATLVSVSGNKFVAKTDQGREIEFNPEEISFKHGYASTVFNAQGASIKDVYVLHNLAGNARNSYVEMTRHVEQVKLYCNRQATRNMASLISQLARIDNRLASMHFKTLEDLNKMHHEDKNPTIINKLGNWFKYVASDIEDRLHNNKQYYQPTVKAESFVKVAEVLEHTSMNLTQNDQLQEGLNSSYQMLTNSNKQERRINTKLQEDIITNYTSTKDNIKNKNNYDLINKQESLQLKQLLSFKVEDIAHSLLGRPNELLSNNYILRWEKDGKIAMKIRGSKAGIWYDFSKDEGGDLFTLVQRERKCNFVEAKKYLQEIVGMSTVHKQDLLADKSYKQAKTQNQQEQDRKIAKIKQAEGLYEKSSSVLYSTNNNVARQYLGKHRGIEIILEKFQLSQDLKTNTMWDNWSKQYYPALIAFARDKEGKITGGQSIYLNKETGAKADIAVNKRSFGKISGSFVGIQQDNQQENKPRNNRLLAEFASVEEFEGGAERRTVAYSNVREDSSTVPTPKLPTEVELCKKSNITIIAEGVETALSLQEAGIKGKIICSLGINNIKNYQPTTGEKIIIAADNDGQSSISVNTTTKAKEQLANKGAVVSVIMPQDMGDFNDMLKIKGAESIKNLIEPEIAKLTTNETVNEKTTKFTESLKAIDNSEADNNQSQIKSIELELGKSANNSVLQKFQQQIKSLERFVTKDNISTALQIYKEKGIGSFIIYSNDSCSKAIEQKITQDLQIMKNKFDPNYNLSAVKFCDIVIDDFRGKSYTVPEDYLAAIGKDKQVMQYINPQSIIGKEISNELKQASEIKQSQGIRVIK